MIQKKKIKNMTGEYPLLQIDPLLTDVDDKDATVECVLCDNYESVDNDDDSINLYWYEYHPSVHGAGTDKICDHCLFPLPKNIDFVMCSREKHRFCLYCIELKLFRVQLGRFVMEPDDVNDLGMQWERDYVHVRNQKGGGRGRARSVTGQISSDGICGCFGKSKNDFFQEDNEEKRVETTRIAGYKSAKNDGFNDSMIEMQLTGDKKKKNKKKSGDNNGPNGSDELNGIDEAEIDEMFGEEFEVNNDDQVVLGHNKKKLKAVELLLEACKSGNRQPPSVIIELNYDKYAVYCFTYVMGKLELKQRTFLFHTLEFIAMVSPTTVMIQLIMQYKKQVLMLPYKRIDKVLLAVIRGSKYSIATSLKMAALAAEFAAIDLSAKETFLKLKEKYEGIAVELIRQIESHHLAAVLLETPSDIEGMTPLEVAFEYKLFSFLSQSKIEKIAHQVWYEQFFLNPQRTFEVSDIDAWNVLEFLKNPYKFYFQPFGKYLIQSFLFFAYLFMFSYILFKRPGIFDLPDPIEIIFWVFNVGYFGYELYQALIEDGLKEYLSDWTNYIDMSISVNFAAQIILRVIWIFGASTAIDTCDNNKLDLIKYNYNSGLPLADYQKCPTTSQIGATTGYWLSGCDQTFSDWPLPSNSSINELCQFEPSRAFYYSASFKCDCWKQLDYYLSNSCCRNSDSTEAVLFNFLYGFNAILLWTRTLYFAEQNSTLGPLIKIIMAMKSDFVNYLKLTILLMIGFSFAIRAFIGRYSFEFDTVSSTILYMFKSTFGKIDFSVLEGCGDSPSDLCKDKGWIPFWRSNLVQLLIMTYLIIALIMIRLLIAMISFTYNKMIRQAEHQVVYQYIKNAYEFDRSSGLMPPPLNIFVFALAIVWLIMDMLMVILINRYIDVENHLQLAKPIGTSYVKRVWHGIQDLFSRNTSYWICAYCKEHNHEKYDINRYLQQFRPQCDPADTKIVEVYAPELCQKCYRNKSAVGRMTIILQQISFLVFCVVVYPCLFLVVFIPAIISWFADFLSDDNGEGQWGETDDDDDDDDKNQQLKRHQTMAGNPTNGPQRRKDSAYKRSAEYKLKKKREKEARKKKEMIKRAEKYRMLRQMQQLDTQLNAISTTDSHTTLTALKKSLKQIIKNYNPRSTKHILTPNINEIVDEVTSDKTPIAKLQNQVKELKKTVDDLVELVTASQKFNVAQTLVNMQSVNPHGSLENNNFDIDNDEPQPQQLDGSGGGGGGVDDSTMLFASKAAEQLQAALVARTSNVVPKQNNLPSTGLANRVSSQQTQRLSVKDIASTLLMPSMDDDQQNAVEAVNDSVIYKPTDVMKHKSSYKRKSANNLFGGSNDVIIDDDDDDDDDDDNKEAVISSNITVEHYNFKHDHDVILSNDIEAGSGVEEEEEQQQQQQQQQQQTTNNNKKIPFKNQMSDNTEKYLDSLLDEEMNTDTEKP